MSVTRRQFVLGAISGVATLVVDACGKQLGVAVPTKATKSAATSFVTVAQGTDVESWDPYGQSSTPSYNVWEHIFDTLVGYDWNQKKFVGQLAESWQVKPDNLTWVFNLRKGVRFQDGSAFTSADVLYSYQRIIHDPQSKQASEFRPVAKMEAPDPYTLVLVTKAPYSPLLGHLTQRVILSSAAAKKYGSQAEMDRHPIGTGPYKFVSWERGQQFVVAANDAYWGGKPVIQGGAFRPIPEAQARLTALQTGSVQLMENLPPQDVGLVAKSKASHVASVKSGRIMFIGMQPHSNTPLSDKRVRQAINYAVDVNHIIKYVLDGRAYRNNQVLSDIFFGYDPNYKGYAYDPQRAKSLLKQAGFGSGMDLTLHSPNGRYIQDKEIAQAIAGQLQHVGIRCTVQTAEWGTYASNFEAGHYPMFLIGRGGIYDPDDYLTQYFETGVTRRIGYSNPAVDALFKQEQATFDQAKRIPILQEISRRIMADAPIIPLFDYQDNYGVSDHVIWSASPDERVELWTMKWVG